MLHRIAAVSALLVLTQSAPSAIASMRNARFGVSVTVVASCRMAIPGTASASYALADNGLGAEVGCPSGVRPTVRTERRIAVRANPVSDGRTISVQPVSFLPAENLSRESMALGGAEAMEIVLVTISY